MTLNLNAPDSPAMDRARAKWDSVAKPIHSLGILEDLVVQIAGIQGTADVRVSPRCVLVLCGDHGVTEEGVTQSDSSVTALVAKSILEGTSNINLMARSCGADVFAADLGMCSDVPGLFARKMGRGTQNLARGPAMTRIQAENAVSVGRDLTERLQKDGYRLLCLGEMGIGNTTAAAAITCALLDLSPEEIVGRGAGLSDEGLRCKVDTVRRALAVNRPDPEDPMDVLSKLGGFEIAGLVGACLGGMEHRIPIVLDGVLSAAAALLAVRICPAVRPFLLPSHLSREPAAKNLFDALDMAPILHGDLALVEGTGAVLLLPLLDAALSVCQGPHTFARIGLTPYERLGGPET